MLTKQEREAVYVAMQLLENYRSFYICNALFNASPTDFKLTEKFRKFYGRDDVKHSWYTDEWDNRTGYDQAKLLSMRLMALFWFLELDGEV